jgi:two-component system, chemotaxis family, chemotaxis protein CheY
MKVLVVDDSEMTRMIAKKTLKQLGVSDVCEAEDGQVALKVFQAESPDVVFSDWNMPNMDGFTLLQEIRKLNKDVPVIMITTEGSRGKVVSAIQEGANDYLVKPFTPASLKEKLAKWVGATV